MARDHTGHATFFLGRCFILKMNTNDHSKGVRPWLLKILFLVVVLGLLAAIAIPNHIGGGPGKLSSVINLLREIDAAKEYWATQQGATNGAPSLREITEQDIAAVVVRGDGQDHFDRFGFGFDKNGNIHGAEGVMFVINPLGKSPEARFTANFKLSKDAWPWGPKIPKGTVMRFGRDEVEFILPGQESKPCRSLDELLSR
jgi:hypothetical protein